MLSKIIDLGIFSLLFLSSIVLFTTPFEFYISYIPLLILLVIFIFKYKFPTQLVYLFLPLLLFGFINIFQGNNTMNDFLKIYLNIFIAVLFFYYVFEYYNRDVQKFFSIYMNFSFWVCVIGLIQFISYLIGFKFGYDFHWLGLNKWGIIPGGSFGIRVNSLFSEPSYMAATIGPAFFISLYNVIFKKGYFINQHNSILIIVIYLLTYSSVAYLGILFVAILLLINFGFVRYLVVVLPLVIVIFYYLYNNVEDFRNRMNGISSLYIEGVLEKDSENDRGGAAQQFSQSVKMLRTIHGSSFVQYNNYVVAKENFVRNPLFGTGLGSHGIAFEKYNLNSLMGNQYKFNTTDANSMLLRIISETGLFGILFMFFFIKNNYVKRDSLLQVSDYHWLISNAVLVMILLQLARQGNYTYGGFMAYMWLYYYIKLDYTNKKEDLNLKIQQQEEATANNEKVDLIN